MAGDLSAVRNSECPLRRHQSHEQSQHYVRWQLRPLLDLGRIVRFGSLISFERRTGKDRQIAWVCGYFK